MNPVLSPGMNAVLWLVGGLGSFAIGTLVSRLLSPAPTEEAGSLSALGSKALGEVSSFERINPQGGFLDRIDYFLAKTLGLDQRFEELHMMRGRPEDVTPLQMLHHAELAAVGVPIFLWIMLYVFTDDPFHPLTFLLAPGAFFIPEMIHRGKIQDRQTQIVRSFPSLVDLLALTIESGLDYMAALDRIVKNAARKTELEREVEKTLKEVQLGYSRREALRRMALRTGLQEVRSFVGLIVQSDELGTSLVDLLRNYSQDLRFRRLNRAEKAAAQASTKMLFPIFLFIFPTVFILMLAPMLMNLFQGGLGF